MNRISFMDSISGRILLLGVLPTVLTLAAIVAWGATRQYRAALQSQEQILSACALGAAAELSVRNDRWNSTAAMLAASQREGLFGRRGETIAFLRAAKATSDLNLSVYVVYEPNADGKDAESLQSNEIDKDALDENGRFVPVIYDEYQSGLRTGQIKVKPSVEMDTLDYYLLPKSEFTKTGRPAAVITEPYFKEGATLISQVFPIVISGKFAGIAGVNRNLNVLTDIASSMKKRFGADVFILSSGGEFIAATTDLGKTGEDLLKGRAISQTPYSSIAANWQSMTAGQEANVFELQDPVLGEECVYAISKVAQGNWQIITRRPVSEVMKEANASILRSILIGAAGILVVAGLMYFATRPVTRRVRTGAEAAERIALGDLTEPIKQDSSRDETGQLMRSMDTMYRNLNALIGSVKQASIRLNSTATEIAATSKQQEASASTFGAASSQIAAAVKEISATGRDLVLTMESVNENALQTANLAAAGRSGLHGMESVMHELDRATVSISEKLGTINERSQKITSVVTAITKVADQTNILSINAAIEAEKAGEFGAGFLVIAREIRRLADQTASATLDIEQMVQQMQASVSSGVMEMDRFSDQVRRGVREVASAGSQLAEIIDRVNQSTESFKQVNESTQAQSEGAQQISEAMTSLSANAHQTMQAVQEFSNASTDLQSAIALLRQAVAQFKLKE